MNTRKRFTVSMIFALLLLVFVTNTAFAHYCTNPNKKEGAGSVGVVNIATGEETVLKKNGGFITVTDGETFSYDIFIHTTLPDGAMRSGPGGSSQCDGKGIDNALVCLGFIED
jgi:hypothetical protein